MIRSLILCFFISLTTLVSAQNINHGAFTTILQKYVDDDGFVDYGELEDDLEPLEDYIAYLEKNPPQRTWSKDAKKAYWINAYNAVILKVIADAYPIRTILNRKAVNRADGDGEEAKNVFEVSLFEYEGRLLSLKDIEDDILREQFNDPNIHFALNCASLSCPKLLNKAYLPENLSKQLEDQAIEFINDPVRNEVNELSLSISKIFNWYERDWTQKGTSIVEVFQKYSKTKVSSTVFVGYKEYDWNLNDSRRKNRFLEMLRNF